MGPDKIKNMNFEKHKDLLEKRCIFLNHLREAFESLKTIPGARIIIPDIFRHQLEYEEQELKDVFGDDLDFSYRFNTETVDSRVINPNLGPYASLTEKKTLITKEDQNNPGVECDNCESINRLFNKKCFHCGTLLSGTIVKVENIHEDFKEASEALTSLTTPVGAKMPEPTPKPVDMEKIKKEISKECFRCGQLMPNKVSHCICGYAFDSPKIEAQKRELQTQLVNLEKKKAALTEIQADALKTSFHQGGRMPSKSMEEVVDAIGEISKEHKLPFYCSNKDAKFGSGPLTELEIGGAPITGGHLGPKQIDGKARLDLIPPMCLFELAKVYNIGCGIKYPKKSWEKGLVWGDVYGAIQRHLNSFWGGESLDPEDKLHHLSHAVWGCFTLMIYEQDKIGEDDRTLFILKEYIKSFSKFDFDAIKVEFDELVRGTATSKAPKKERGVLKGDGDNR